MSTSDTALVKLSAARTALAECKTVMRAKEISAIAEAARVYLERTHASAETVNEATEIRLLAEKQMGEFLHAAPKNEGGNPKLTGSRTEPVEPTLASIGITKKESMMSQKLAAIPTAEFHERIESIKAAGEKLTTAKVMNVHFTERARRAGDEAEKDSEGVWRLKSLWRKTNKKDRAAFVAWIQKEAAA